MDKSIAERYREIEDRKNAAAVRSGRAPEDVVLMAVTKTHSADEINQAVSRCDGHRGEPCPGGA